MNRRVVITGVGLVTPLGTGVEKTWRALCNGESGMGPITRFDPSKYRTRIAAEVNDFHPEDFLEKKEIARTQPFMAYALAATQMAIEDSGLVIDAENMNRVGVITGCGLGGLSLLEDMCRIIETKGPRRVSPFFIPTLIGNMAAGIISIKFQAKGPNASLATACAAGTHAVGDAFKLVQTGKAEAMITGGVESVVTPSCVAGFSAMKALSTRNDDPERASRPFDRDRDGFVVGEGAGIVILEPMDSALKRGAPIYAEMIGYGMSGDGYHMAAPAPDGEGMARCMQAALDDGRVSYKDIDYINAHGTSTPINDLYETRAIKTVFKEHAPQIAISSTKSMTGHLLGGSGGIETAFTALTVKHGVIPPTINCDHPEEELDLDYVPNVARTARVRCGMSNSFGFGGTNATVIIGEFDPNRS